MERLKNFFLVILMLFALSFSFACQDQLGGLIINSSDTVIGGTVFDTKSLKIIPNDIRGDADYSVKVTGSTEALSDSDWDKWFGDDNPDPLGKMAVCIKLEYLEKIAKDKDANISIVASDSEESKTYLLSEVQDGTEVEPYIYLILNPYHDWFEVTLNYKENNKNKKVNYRIEVLEVQTPKERIQDEVI